VHEKQLLRVFTWFEIDTLTRKVAAKIKEEGFKPDVIIGIQRGGFIPSVHLSHLLNVRTFKPLHVRTTETDQAYSKRCQPIVEYNNLLENLAGKHILLVDEVTNTGQVLAASQNAILEKSPLVLKTAVLIKSTWKEGNLIQTFDNPIIDYLGEIIDCWATFPWEQ